ncbi:MAG: F0F1 ATP synthase subunit B [Lachnospiraceae bacterium]|nr:F0F1 ATP synthase subunit B [Lachnospiraceae bacterium]
MAAEQEGLFNRIFGLDAQLIADAVILALAVGFLFFLLSALLFNPARELMKKRQEKIKTEMETAAKDMADAKQMKAEYDARLAAADKDVDAILSEGRKKALARENEIIAEAKEEAALVLERAEREIELEKSKVKDEVKQEMIGVARAMAGRFVTASMDDETQAKLIDEALNEMGEGTWQS